MMRILPKDNPYLIGHEKAEKLFLEAYRAGTLHHAFLIEGRLGIGKATFAYKIARFLLEERSGAENRQTLDVSPTSSAFLQISNGAHPNFKAIEKDYIETDKKKIIKAIKDGEPLDEATLQNLKKSSVIKIDDVREIRSFFSKKSFNGSWRVVLIDSADDLNPASANALLKVLEEPPAKSMILLVCNNPNTLLATIKSRCLRLSLEPLSEENVATLLRRYAPELSNHDVEGLAKISGGSIGDALNYAQNNGLARYEKMQSVFGAGTRFDLKTALDLANIGAADDEVFELMISLMSQFVYQMALDGQEKSKFAEIYAHILRLKNEVIALNMDKRQALLNTFYLIAKEVSNAC